MTKQNSPEWADDEVGETLDTANKIVGFYKEVLASQTAKISALEAENRTFKKLLLEARGVLRETTKAPLGGPSRSHEASFIGSN